MKISSVLLVLFVAITLLTVGCGTKPASPVEALFQQADELRLANDYDAAIQIYQSIHDQYLEDPDVSSYAEEMIAFCYSTWAERLIYTENNPKAAIEKLQILVEQYPDTDPCRTVTEEGLIPMCYFRLASDLEDKHDYQSAIEKYEFVISEYPQSAAEAKEGISQCYGYWGYHLYDEENYTEAMEKYQVVLTQYPESGCASQLRVEDNIPDCYYGLAEQAEEQGNLDKAIESCEAILQGWPHSPRTILAGDKLDKLLNLYLVKASRYQEEGRWGEAFDIYEEILSRFPDSTQAFNIELTLLPQWDYEYGKLLQDEGKFQEAIEKYKASGLKEAKGMIPECYYLWVQQLQEEGQYAEALEKYVTIISDYPDSDWASWEKGEILKPVPPEYLYAYAAELGISEAVLRLYQAILDYHPGSDYLAAVQKAMVDIGIALIMKEEHGTLPPATSEGSIAAGDTAVIEVRNGTPYTLLVLFKGPETKMVYLKPDPDAEEYLVRPLRGMITEYTEETIRLAPGEYQIGARVSETGIAPWYGTQTFKVNQQYSQIFWLQVKYG